ncbi:MAG: tRNA epoxyqueuosine(34) reductase QueG [Sedimentisphaerales bacterium]|nr:tRNA epoxyqueuosine(34) reductase QueG [Sedimentisphaerales bacterium]
MVLDSALVKQLAGQLGFDLVGITAAADTGHGGFLRDWLGHDYHGSMSYMAQNMDKRVDVRQLFAWSRSVICVGMNYYGGAYWKGKTGSRWGKIARYAWRADYHDVLKQRLAQLREKLGEFTNGGGRFRICVDTVPLLEKAYAARAGLGWIGKNGLLVNKCFGSWLVLGELVTDLELEADAPVADGCGDCRRCLDGCPTGALLDARLLDARRCVSYLTIESNEALSGQPARQMGDWVFGCDVCQEVCPFNRGLVREDAHWRIDDNWTAADLAIAVDLDEQTFADRYGGSSIERMGSARFVERCRAVRYRGGK